MTSGKEHALSEVCCKEIRMKSEIVRLYFRARSGKVEPFSLVMPSPAEECKHTDFSSFAPEWSSSLDSAYDSLAR